MDLGSPSHVINRIITTSLFILLVVILNCSKNPANSDKSVLTPATLAISPSHGAPGAPIVISGYTLDVTDLASYSVSVGGLQTALATDSTGAPSTIAPLFLDSVTLWHAPPDSALDVSIFRHDTLVAVAKRAFTSDSLQKSPGATKTVVVSINELGQAMKDMMSSFPLQPGIQQQLFFGLSAAIDSFTASQNLQGLLDSLSASPKELDLLDALIASSGFDAQASAITDGFVALASALQSGSRGHHRGLAVELNDVRLSKMMQTAAVLDEYANTFVHGVNDGLGKIGTGITLFSTISKTIKDLFDEFPLFDKMMTALSIGYAVADLLYSKFLVAGLPTVLDSIVIGLASDTVMTLNDTTRSSIEVFASSNPPAVNADELLGLFLDVAGLALPEKLSEKEQYIAKLKTLLGFLKKALKDYKTAHPDFGYNPDIVDLFAIPKIEYHATITDTTLLELKVGATDTEVEPLQGLLEWRSVEVGSADVFVEVFPAEVSVNGLFFGFPVPLPLTFNTTTFGDMNGKNEVPFSKRHKLTVTNLFLDIVSFPNVLHRDSAAELVVVAGHIDQNGTHVPEEGLPISLLETGGFAVPSAGVTDGLGQFTSSITVDSGFDTLALEITVEDNVVSPNGNVATIDTVIFAPVTAQPDTSLFLNIVSFPSVLHPDSAAGLLVVAGHIDQNGTQVPESGLQINLLATGAIAAPSAGITDVAGEFTSKISPNLGVDTVKVVVVVTDDVGNQVADTAVAIVKKTGGGRVFVTKQISIVQAGAGAGDGQCKDAMTLSPTDFGQILIDTMFQCAAFAQGEFHSASVNLHVAMQFTVDSLTSAFSGMSLQAQSVCQRTRTGLASSYALVVQGVEFEVRGAPVQFTATGRITAEDGFGDTFFLSGVYQLVGRNGLILNESGLLAPGRYTLLTRYETADWFSGDVDFAFVITP